MGQVVVVYIIMYQKGMNNGDQLVFCFIFVCLVQDFNLQDKSVFRFGFYFFIKFFQNICRLGNNKF